MRRGHPASSAVRVAARVASTETPDVEWAVAMKRETSAWMAGLCALASLSSLAGFAELQERTARANAVKSGAVPVKGAELHYVSEGRGLPCLVIGHAESYRLLLSRKLRDRFQFTFVDLRHDARSGSSLKLSEITLDTYLDDIDAVSRALGLGRFAIFGHSHHAYVALQYARKYPEKISHVVMTGCAPCDISHTERDKFWESDASDERKALFARKWEEFLRQRPKMPANEQESAMLIAQAPKLRWNLRENPALFEAFKAVHNNTDAYLHYQLTILGRYDIAEEWGRIAAPIFLALGRFDYVAPYLLWEERKGALPNLSYNLFNRSGHFPMFEEQQLFDEKLIAWISR
jgi:proline iminopeptidase